MFRSNFYNIQDIHNRIQHLVKGSVTVCYIYVDWLFMRLFFKKSMQ